MIFLDSSRLLQILTCILLLTQSFSDDHRKTYIVYMGEHRKDVESIEGLHTNMIRSVLDKSYSELFAPNALLHSYKNFNGFVARLTEEEAERMEGMDGVVSVLPNKINKPQTSRSWDFLDFPVDVPRTQIEGDIVVGVIDSGIWPESLSFDDDGFGPPPNTWKGNCRGAVNFTCNYKIVGAKYFRIDGKFSEDDIISPRDTSGHGSHCASTAAGNPTFASLFGLGSGLVRGGVPSARIAVYKVCWSMGCDDADILAAFDEAISDGVDIISISVGPSKVLHWQYFRDVYAVGAFHAMKNGILTSKTADNLGPKVYTMSNTAPWLLSVAASTIDRKIFTNLQLGNGKIYMGISINTFDLKNNMYPLIYGGDAPNTKDGYNSSTSRFCLENSLDRNLVRGKIVLCNGFSSPGLVGFASGATGVIFASTLPLVVADTFALPAVHVSQNDGNLIYSYLQSTSYPTATIFKSYEGNDSSAPYIAPFSSRGPNAITPDILKPDLAAPGVNILAAWSPISSVSGVEGDRRVANYNFQYGTSMACPHVTAAAAYIKSFHPNWSPAAIKSALMTTATPMSATLNEEAEFAYGAGQINPIKAVNPGLVYDASAIDYINFLCGQGYDIDALQIITGDFSICTDIASVWDLNLPSFALSTTTNSRYVSAIFHRTVTNVGSATSIYKAMITTYPSSLNIQVVPNVMRFSYLGQKMSFALKIEGFVQQNIISSSLIWDDGTYLARSPIVVYIP